MLDLRWIREQPDELDRALGRRGQPARSPEILALDKVRRELQTRLQELQTERNRLSKEIGAAKARKLDAADLMAKVVASKAASQRLEEQEKATATELDAILAMLPNAPDTTVPDGKDEHDNIEVRRVGTPKNFAFEAKEHAAIGTALGLMDFDAAARISGARFVILKGPLARLERALGAFMLDLQTGEHGYSETVVPHLVLDDAAFGTGQLPKFEDDLFRIDAGTPLATGDKVMRRRWLIPTAEVPLTNLVREQIVDGAALPMRLAAQTPCYRSEAGAAGKDTTGMIRQHQFTKVELVSITRPENSDAEYERMTQCAEEVLKRLDLPYRTMLLCSGDMGFAARKTYDIEVWLPGQGRYREISSCSNCGDFQARRMNARFKRTADAKPEFVHTLNGSGLAVGRTLIAVLENYQNADGSVTVPAPLRPYMGGLETIRRGN
ncbi:MAG: serine--tRNA ligase [Alphaproteobacteria bacterium]|nr:serine--tRNA ligase [Alphaproteobacteria bacterium]